MDFDVPIIVQLQEALRAEPRDEMLINFLQGERDAELYFARQQESYQTHQAVLSGNYIFDSINLLIDPADRGFPAAILASARSFAHVLISTRAHSAFNSRRPAPAETKLIRRTERLLRERRTGAAMQSTEQLQDLIDRDLVAEAGLALLLSSYSLDTVRSTLASLYPPASDKDTLTPDHLLSIAQSSPLIVTASDVLAVFEHLPSGALLDGPMPQ